VAPVVFLRTPPYSIKYFFKKKLDLILHEFGTARRIVSKLKTSRIKRREELFYFILSDHVTPKRSVFNFL